MPSMSKFIAAVFLALLSCPAMASAPGDVSARQALLQRVPDSLETGRVLAFCPDNTCIRVRSTNAGADLEGWLLAYLFHFGDYYVLTEWRAEIASSDRIQGYPDALKGCFAQADPLACSKAAFADAKIEVGFVRYDEGQWQEGDAWPDPADETAKD